MLSTSLSLEHSGVRGVEPAAPWSPLRERGPEGYTVCRPLLWAKGGWWVAVRAASSGTDTVSSALKIGSTTWHCTFGPKIESADVANSEGEHCGACRGEEGTCVLAKASWWRQRPSRSRSWPVAQMQCLASWAVLLSKARTCSVFRAVTTSKGTCTLASIWNAEMVLRTTDPPRHRRGRRSRRLSMGN